MPGGSTNSVSLGKPEDSAALDDEGTAEEAELVDSATLEIVELAAAELLIEELGAEL